ncbi:IS630 family transposase [Mesorhizobium sediminum]|nr:IS630 family transposase [Mesorhizobium sediminum]
MIEFGERSAQVVQLSHGGTSRLVVCSAQGAIPSRRAPHSIYKRNDTTTLFAALNMLDGKVIGTCMPRHRHREFLRFLKLIDHQTPSGLDLHLVVDNYANHKTPAVKRWLKAHPRFHLHFTPTSASWLNMVERFFAEITQNRIRRGAFKSVAELESAIMEYLDNHNANPKPFIHLD